MKKLAYILPGLMLVPQPAFAQLTRDPCSTTICAGDFILPVRRIVDDEITVVASGLSDTIEDVGQSVSIVGLEEIETVQGPDLTRVLERLPGVTLTRNGGPGAFTGLRVRGANAEQVLVLVDGVRMGDVAAPGGGYDFGNMLAGGIGKVELLRGSNSVAWGSEAIGGVVAVTSRDLNGIETVAEYGARESLDGQVNAGVRGDRYSVAVNAGYTRTDGFSAAAGGIEPDGFRQWRFGGKARIELDQALTASVVGRHSASRLDIDGFPPPDYAFADTAEFQETRQTSGRAGLAYNGQAVMLAAGVAMARTDRDYFDPAFGKDPNYATRGHSLRAELVGRWRMGDQLRIDFGAAREWSRFSSTFDTRRKAATSSVHALLGWHHRSFDFTAGVRIDDHSRFGSEVTLGANGTVEVGRGWRLRASYGEGFKAPTLFQLYSDYGNGTLRPERSRSFDAGIELGDRNVYGLHAAVTAYRRDTRGLIDYVSCFGLSSGICQDRPFGTYDNVGKARAQGIEVELGARVSQRLRAQVAYSYVKAIDRTPGGSNHGSDLARRPRHAVSLSVDWVSPVAGLAVGGDIRMLSGSWDAAGNLTRIEGHALGTVRMSLPLGETLEVFGRIENVTNEHYVTSAGYETPGRSAFVGARARFR